MKRTSRWGFVTVAALLTGVLLLGAPRLEVAPNPKGDGQTAMRAYLLRVTTYPDASPVIKVWATFTLP